MGTVQTITYDQATNALIDSNVSAGVLATSSYPKVYRLNEHAIIRANIYSDASSQTKANLNALTFTAKIGTVGSTALVTANNASFNSTNDWSSANVSTGQICFWINTCGTALDTAIGSQDSKTLTCDIMATDVNSDDMTVAGFYTTIVNVVE